METLKIDSLEPAISLLSRAASVIKDGGLVAFPTETFYGLGASALNEEAIKKIFKIKAREKFKPILILLDSPISLSQFVSEVPLIARKLIDQFWPGALTLIFSASPHLSPLLTGNTGKIGIRVSGSPLVRKLVQLSGVPLTGTSANRSGKSPCFSPSQVIDQLGDRISLLIDGGDTQKDRASTIVDITLFPPRLIRKGIVPFEEIKNIIPSLSSGSGEQTGQLS